MRCAPTLAWPVAPAGVGEVVDLVEGQRRLAEAKARNEPHFYMMEMSPGGARAASSVAGGPARARAGFEPP